MTILFANNANTTIAGAINNTATSVNLAAGAGALFPSPSAGQYFLGTFNDAATGLLTEIVECTGRSVDTLTVVRAQEGTTALNWNAGDLFANLITAGTLSTLQASIPSLAGARRVAGGSTIAPATTDGLVSIVNVLTSPTIYQLPASPTAGRIVIVKDSGGNFGQYNCTVVTTDGTQIDGISGATGWKMIADWQKNQFEFDGTSWCVTA